MTIYLDSLEARAKEATPGPWVNTAGYKIKVAATGTHCASAWSRYTYDTGKEITDEQAKANAAFIAAANPAVVLELIAEVRKARMYMAERHAFRAAWKEEWVLQNMLAGWLESIAKGETPACMAECKTAHDFVSYAAWVDAKQRGLPCSETFKNSEVGNV